jgi:hypothetical protein
LRGPRPRVRGWLDCGSVRDGDRGWRFLVEQILQRVGRRFPRLAHQDLGGGAFDDADIRRVRRDDHRVDLLRQLGSVQAGVILQGVDRPVSLHNIVGDVRLGPHDRQGNVFVPGNHGGETVLQDRHFTDQRAEFAVGGAGGATRPDASVKDFRPLVLAGL